MFKRTALSLVLAAFFTSSFAADFHVVVPLKGRPVASSILVNLSSTALAGAVVGAPFSYDFNQNLQVTGDSGFSGAGVSWSVVAGALPAGLALNSGTGVLSGAPTATGSSSFDVRASYKAQVCVQGYAMKVASPIVTAALSADTLSDFGAVALGSTVARQFTFASIGNSAATGVAVSLGGASTSGLSLTANTCGTPATPGTVPAGGACSFTVSYAPSAVATLSAAAVVASSASNSPSSMVLTGSGALPTGYAVVAGRTWAYSGTAVPYSSAVPYCQTLTALGGGWRLPTLAEANTLASSAANRSALLAAGWGNTTWHWMWTSTLYELGQYNVFRVDSVTPSSMFNGYEPWSSSYRVTCVKA